jgi:hypothetical protein
VFEEVSVAVCVLKRGVQVVRDSLPVGEWLGVGALDRWLLWRVESPELGTWNYSYQELLSLSHSLSLSLSLSHTHTHTHTKRMRSSDNSDFISHEVFVANVQSLRGTRWRQHVPTETIVSTKLYGVIYKNLNVVLEFTWRDWEKNENPCHGASLWDGIWIRDLQNTKQDSCPFYCTSMHAVFSNYCNRCTTLCSCVSLWSLTHLHSQLNLPPRGCPI